jgi:outer membrane protein assembly factor BamB
MKSPRLSPALLALVVALGLAGCSTPRPSQPVMEANWPGWRGPWQTGVAPLANPPVTFSESENLKWKVKLPGQGTSTPIVWGENVFILTAIPKGPVTAAATPTNSAVGPAAGMVEPPGEVQQFVVLCYDRASGQERWRRVVREQAPVAGHHKDHGYASASPVTDGKTLIAHFNSYGTYGLDLAGRLLWETDLGDMQTRNDFGEGSSPALDGNFVVVLWDHEGEDFIVALDKDTGKERWRQLRDEPTGWSTPLIVSHQGRKVVVVNGTNRVRAYDLATGEPLWDCAGQTANAIPTPAAADGVVYVTSGFRGSALQAIQLGHRGEITSDNGLLWSRKKNTPYVPSPLLYEGLLYLFSGNNATLSIIEARTGEAPVDAERLEGIFGVYASPAGAAGRVYVAGRDGNVWVLKAGPQIEVLAKTKFNEGFDASPAPAGRQLFLRGREHLYCLVEAK